MKIIVSLSAKQVGILYHSTNKQALLKILRSGNLALSTGRAMMVEGLHQGSKNFFASLTRSRFGGYHYREGGKRSLFGNTQVMITLDGTRLSDREKILPVDYWNKRGETDKVFDNSKEVEERLISNKSEIPILKYIKRVDLIQPATDSEIETYGVDIGKLKRRENDSLSHMLGSIILQLKKHKIPYGFYDSMDDWAKQRNEYTYIGPKDVAKENGYNGYVSKYSYKDLISLIECLSDTPYAQMSPSAQKRCYDLYNHPRDIEAAFNDYENARKPDANATMRAVANKLARVLQRKGFTSKTQAGEFIRAKTQAHFDQERKKDLAKTASEAAPLIVAALTLPMSEWPTHKNHYIDPKSVFGEITDRFGYMYGEAERFVTRVLESDVPEVDDLKAVMKKLHISDAFQVVSEIFYEKVKPLQAPK